MDKRFLISGVLALLVGAIAAFALFAASFNLPEGRFAWEALLPLCGQAEASFLLSRFNRNHWRTLAALAAAPSVLMCAALGALLMAEQRGSGGWLMLAAIVAAVCFIPAWVAVRGGNRAPGA